MSKKLLSKWRDHCQCYRVLHSCSYEKYKKMDAKLRIPAIIITSLAAGLAFSVQAFPAMIEDYVPVFVGGLNLIAGTFVSIASFHKTAEEKEGHRIAAVSFSKLRRKIVERLELYDEIGNEFVNGIREDLDVLIEGGPPIPLDVINLFAANHKDTDLNLPSIVDIALGIANNDENGIDIEHGIIEDEKKEKRER